MPKDNNVAKIKEEAAVEKSEVELKSESLVCDLRDKMIGKMKELPRLNYDMVSEMEQQALADDIEDWFRDALARVIQIVTSKESTSIQARIESVTIKKGIKFTVTAKDTEENYGLAGKILHKDIMLTGLSVKDFDEVTRPAEVSPDQSSLLDDEGSEKYQEENIEGAGAKSKKKKDK